MNIINFKTALTFLMLSVVAGCAIDNSVDSYGNAGVLITNKTAVNFILEIERQLNGNVTSIGTDIAPMSSVRLWVTGDIKVSYNNKSIKIPYNCESQLLEKSCSLILDSLNTSSILK